VNFCLLFCKRGHRRTSESLYTNGACKICSRNHYKRNKKEIQKHHKKWIEKNIKKIQRFMKAWRKKNLERVQEYNRCYYAKNLEREKERVRRWRAKNPEKVSEYKDKWAKNNPQKANGIKKRWAKNNPEKVRDTIKKYRMANIEKIVEYRRKYTKENLEKAREKCHRRRVLKLQLPYEKIDHKLVWERDGGICQICKDSTRPVSFEEMHLDHIIPLSKGGHHVYGNVQAAHAHCNLVKSNKILGEVNYAERFEESQIS